MAGNLGSRFSEQKRLAKQEQKAKEKAAKDAQKAQQPAKTAKAQRDGDPSDPQEYFNMRVQMINSRRDAGDEPFPHKFHVTTSLTDFTKKYSYLEKGVTLEDVTVSVAGKCLGSSGDFFVGRIFSKREQGAKLIFYDLRGECTQVQIMANARYHTGSDFASLHDRIKRGDIVGFTGHPCRSAAGELSVVPTEVVQLTPCLHMLPHTYYGLRDQETRYAAGTGSLVSGTECATWT